MFKLKNRVLASILAAALALGLGCSLADAQTAATPTNFRNVLIGGDFGTNPYQLGTTAVTGITTTGTFHADRWFGYSSASSVYLTRITTGLPNGFTAGEQLARTAANANTSAVCMAQTLETQVAAQLAGQPVILSYYAAAGANFSGTGVQAILTTSTAATGTRASLIAGTWTGQANVAGIALQPLISVAGSYARYQAAVTMPTGILGAAVQLCFNGVGTAGTTDGVIFGGIQLEVAQGPIVTGVTSLATPFERRPVGTELSLAQRYLFVLNDAAATVKFPSSCAVTAANTTVVCGVTFPVQMVQAPVTTVTVAASFGIVVTAGTNGTCTTLAATASSNAVNSGSVTCTTGGTIALGSATPLIGQATAGQIQFSAEF